EAVPVVKTLEWDEVTAARSNEDPTREPTGDYEAVSPIGVYYVEQYFGSDGYGWRVTLHGSDDVADMDDPEDAKAAAQADYGSRILSALASPPAQAGAVTEAMVEAAAQKLQPQDWDSMEPWEQAVAQSRAEAALTAALGAQTPPEGAVTEAGC